MLNRLVVPRVNGSAHAGVWELWGQNAAGFLSTSCQVMVNRIVSPADVQEENVVAVTRPSSGRTDQTSRPAPEVRLEPSTTPTSQARVTIVKQSIEHHLGPVASPPVLTRYPLDFLDDELSTETKRTEPSASFMHPASGRRTQLCFSNTVVAAPPEFLTMFNDQICRLGELVRLDCQVAGVPTPKASGPIRSTDLLATTLPSGRLHFIWRRDAVSWRHFGSRHVSPSTFDLTACSQLAADPRGQTNARLRRVASQSEPFCLFLYA
ncbi:unnamed protein product [Protopolystoma xenopodis]|uniref:Uncharacterized protein n=1 Tax=Protopolystoma xenopodis TaxID=117903 RepID=A0A3S5ASW3_9PLAT|nr:unnamed protein product [Protopolystoma xenopodis]